MAEAKTTAKTSAKTTAKRPATRKPAAAKKTAAAAAAPGVADQLHATGDAIIAEATRKAEQLRAEAGDLAAQAGTKAKEAATKGKHKAAETVGSVAKMLEDSAATVDDKFGKQYGDYARSAASTVAGLASTLDEKDLDELAEATREMVRKNPAIAVGAAAVIGFVLARMLKGGRD